jgi:hypothetical protein
MSVILREVLRLLEAGVPGALVARHVGVRAIRSVGRLG